MHVGGTADKLLFAVDNGCWLQGCDQLGARNGSEW